MPDTKPTGEPLSASVKDDASTDEQLKALKKIEAGVGWVTDQQLGDFFTVHRKSIWDWTAQGRFPPPKKISPNRTRWSCATVKKHNDKMKELPEKEFLSELYGEGASSDE